MSWLSKWANGTKLQFEKGSSTDSQVHLRPFCKTSDHWNRPCPIWDSAFRDRQRMVSLRLCSFCFAHHFFTELLSTHTAYKDLYSTAWLLVEETLTQLTWDYQLFKGNFRHNFTSQVWMGDVSQYSIFANTCFFFSLKRGHQFSKTRNFLWNNVIWLKRRCWVQGHFLIRSLNTRSPLNIKLRNITRTVRTPRWGCRQRQEHRTSTIVKLLISS